MASRIFNQRNQQPIEKVDGYASKLKWFFKQVYPAEIIDSTVLLQKFLTGLQPSIARTSAALKTETRKFIKHH